MELQKGVLKNKWLKGNWDQEKKSMWKKEVEGFFWWELGIRREKTRDGGEKKEIEKNKR